MSAFVDLVAAEWMRLRGLRSTPWALAATTVIVVATAAGTAPRDSPFTMVGYMILMIVAVSTGAAVIVGEYGSGHIRTTLIAVPARRELLLAKAFVVCTLWTVVGAVCAGAAFLVSGQDYGPRTPTALAAATLVAPVCALFGLGLGVVVRHGITTTVLGIAALQILPAALSTRQKFTAELNYTMVLSAWQRLTESYGPPAAVGALYGRYWESWVVYAAWPLVAILVGVVVIHRRDA
jgi:ABC-2 type transport system permease protein